MTNVMQLLYIIHDNFNCDIFNKQVIKLQEVLTLKSPIYVSINISFY